jgi:beta-lactamase class A
MRAKKQKPPVDSQRHSPRQAQTAKSQKRSLRRLFKVLGIAAVLVFSYHFIRGVDLPFNLHGLKNHAKAAAAAPPVLTAAQTAQMASAINSVIQANPGMDIGVAIQDLNSRQSYHYGLSDPFIAASISKILTAVYYLNQTETGKFSLSQDIGGYSAEYEIQQMIEQSDNGAWTNLNGLLTHDGLENYAAKIGLSNYDPDQNTLTVDDISLLLGKLYKNQLLNSADTQLLLSYMHNANEDDYIVASIPSGVKVYHKAGWLADRVHDAAIIDNGKHPYVLVIFTKDDSGTYDSTAGHQIFNSITTASTKAFL